MAKILPKVARWEPSETLGVRYRFYWATCKPVPHNLDYADVGTVTEIRLPADIPTFPRIAGKIVLGVSAVVQSGVESEVTTTIADIDFTIPATPRNLKVEDWWAAIRLHMFDHVSTGRQWSSARLSYSEYTAFFRLRFSANDLIDFVWLLNREVPLGTSVKRDKEKSLKGRKGPNLPERRFGFIAIEKGFIKVDQLYEALMRQRAQETEGAYRRPLGLILKDLGCLSVDQINEILQNLQHAAQPKKPTPRSFK